MQKGMVVCLMWWSDAWKTPGMEFSTIIKKFNEIYQGTLNFIYSKN
jgi:hypothetical protein